jgi:bifunctional oligoribonuclease and PAP phosphatase NrnA
MSEPNGQGGYVPPVTLQEALKGARRIVLTAHVDPDPDALGTALGLENALHGLGWETVPVCIGRLPSFAPSLPGAERILCFPSSLAEGERVEPVLREGDALVVTDTPTATRMAAFYDVHREAINAGPVVVFDHHITNDAYGTVNYVDPKAAATSEVVCDVLEASGIPLSAAAATGLLFALLGDTQCFRTESTSPRSLLWAYRLTEAGAPLFELSQLLFNTRPISGLRLWGRALERLEAHDDVVITSVTQHMLAESDASPEEAEDLVNVLLATKGTQVAIVLKEQPGGETKVSMRTVPGVDATRIVGQFGGGGHQRAAGCTIEAPPEVAQQQLLEATFRELRIPAPAR